MKERVQRGAAAVTVKPETARQLIQQVKRYGRRKVSAEAKVGIVMEGLPGEQAVAELCRREVIKERTKQEPRARYEAWKKRKATLTAEEDGDTLSVGLDRERESTSKPPELSHLFEDVHLLPQRRGPCYTIQ